MCQTPGTVRTCVILLTPVHVIGHIRFLNLAFYLFLLDTVQDVSLLLYDTCADPEILSGGGG